MKKKEESDLIEESKEKKNIIFKVLQATYS